MKRTQARGRNRYLRKVVSFKDKMLNGAHYFGYYYCTHSAVYRTYKLECGHSVRRRLRADKKQRKFILCEWCEAKEEQQA